MTRGDSDYPHGEKYCKVVGFYLVRVLQIILTGLGFDVKLNRVEANDVDLCVYLRGKLVLVIEVLNWYVSSALNDDRKRSYIQNLRQYNCSRLLIYTVPNSNVDGEFARNGIDTLCIGFQLLPRRYYRLFEEREQVVRRRPLSLEAVGDIRRIVKSYIARKGLL